MEWNVLLDQWHLLLCVSDAAENARSYWVIMSPVRGQSEDRNYSDFDRVPRQYNLLLFDIRLKFARDHNIISMSTLSVLFLFFLNQLLTSRLLYITPLNDGLCQFVCDAGFSKVKPNINI